MHILVTGFEPFGPVRHNPSQALVQRLPSALGEHTLHTATLCVDTVRIGPQLRDLYSMSPDVVIHTGVARERPYLSLERIAKNELNFELADNAGCKIQGQDILPGADPVLHSRLPWSEILAAWQSLGVPCELSDDAGAYLCNQAFFLAMSWLPSEVPAGFIHLAPDEVMAPSGPHVRLDLQTEALISAVQLTIEQLSEAVA